MQAMQAQSLGQEDPLEKEMATHSSFLAWEIPWMEETGGPQSLGSQSQTRLRTKQQQKRTEFSRMLLMGPLWRQIGNTRLYPE